MASSRRSTEGFGRFVRGGRPPPRKRSGSRRSKSRPASQAEGSGPSMWAAARSTCRRAWSSGRFVTDEDEAFAVTRVRVSQKTAEERIDLQPRPAQADGHLFRLIEAHAL